MESVDDGDIKEWELCMAIADMCSMWLSGSGKLDFMEKVPELRNIIEMQLEHAADELERTVIARDTMFIMMVLLLQTVLVGGIDPLSREILQNVLKSYLEGKG